MLFRSVPQLMLGDLRALYGCLVVGERQLQELIGRGGFANVRAAGMYAIEQTEASMRAGIARLPDGDYTAEDFLDEDGVVNEKIPVHVTVKVRGDSMEIDFSGSGRQPLGNVGTAWCEATRCVQAVKMLIDPSTPVNSGTMRPIESILPAGSVVQSLPPTSVSNHPDIGSRNINVVSQALAAALEESYAPDTGSFAVIMLGGVDDRHGHEGNPWGTYVIPGGGWGGTYREDGVSFCVPPVGNCRTSVQEHIEIESPLVITQQEMMIDTAGAGKHRGGLGATFTIYAESDVTLSITTDRVASGAPGIEGGGTGMPTYAWYIEGYDPTASYASNPLDLTVAEPLFGRFDDSGRPDPNGGTFGAGTRFQTGKIAGFHLKAGDALRMVCGGGGGWGNPIERDIDRVLTDVRNGLVSHAAARDLYGVVIQGNEVDRAATLARRDELRAALETGRWSVPVAVPVDWIV